jgi:hypothetical protein
MERVPQRLVIDLSLFCTDVCGYTDTRFPIPNLFRRGQRIPRHGLMGQICIAASHNLAIARPKSFFRQAVAART